MGSPYASGTASFPPLSVSDVRRQVSRLMRIPWVTLASEHPACCHPILSSCFPTSAAWSTVAPSLYSEKGCGFGEYLDIVKHVPALKEELVCMLSETDLTSSPVTRNYPPMRAHTFRFRPTWLRELLPKVRQPRTRLLQARALRPGIAESGCLVRIPKMPAPFQRAIVLSSVPFCNHRTEHPHCSWRSLSI